MEQLIGSLRKYVGEWHRWATGQPVIIRAVHRGGPDGVILRSDEEIGELRQDDVVEFAPFVEGDEGVRASWVTSDARPDELVEWEERN